MSHTPAPWTATRDCCHYHSLSTVMAGEDIIAQCGGVHSIAEIEANTRLIITNRNSWEWRIY